MFDFRFWVGNVLPWAAALLVIYVIVLRPIMHAIPALAKFYGEADGFWAKVKALFWKSATIAWGFFVAIVSAATQLMDQFSAALGDPELKQQIQDFFAAYGPKLMLVVSITFIAARLRSIIAANRAE